MFKLFISSKHKTIIKTQKCFSTSLWEKGATCHLTSVGGYFYLEATRFFFLSLSHLSFLKFSGGTEYLLAIREHWLTQSLSTKANILPLKLSTHFYVNKTCQIPDFFFHFNSPHLVKKKSKTWRRKGIRYRTKTRYKDMRMNE